MPEHAKIDGSIQPKRESSPQLATISTTKTAPPNKPIIKSKQQRKVLEVVVHGNHYTAANRKKPK